MLEYSAATRSLRSAVRCRGGDVLLARARAISGSNRWPRPCSARAPPGRPLVDLTESNPTRAGFEYPADLLAPLAASTRAAVRAARRSVCPRRGRPSPRDYARRGVSIAPDRIVLTASTSEAYSLLFKLLSDAGDEVLVPRPSYPLFDHLTRLDEVTAAPYDLEYHDGWTIDIGERRARASRRGRARC